MLVISLKLFQKTRNKHWFFPPKNSALSRYSPLLDIYIDEWIASSVANQIAAFAIVYKKVFTMSTIVDSLLPFTAFSGIL